MRTKSAEQVEAEAEAARIMETGVRLIIERDGSELVVAVDVVNGHARVWGVVIGTPMGKWPRPMSKVAPVEETGWFIAVPIKYQDEAEELWRVREDEDRESRREAAAEMRGAL